MGFKLNCSLEGMEYRGDRGGVSTKTGKPWMSLILEDHECERVEVSVPQDLMEDVRGLYLKKGDSVSLDVVVGAKDGKDGYSYVRLTGLPMINDGEQVDF